MNFHINQHITIHNLRINGISNSSVLQIGSAGSITPSANLYNTGGFTEPAPEAGDAPDDASVPFVPLTPPTGIS
ncbi:spore germination protein GerPB [Salipaludibacillus sp. HK11]|uniref:spore germination protein GerPB n=1 Tax=Salipaludibacillus sp. HK11 TaxID=3394320 RepID=UPI0039FDBFAD